MTGNDVLIRANDLLGEYGICRDAYARDGGGSVVAPLSPQARSFCSMGAIFRAAHELTGMTNADQTTEYCEATKALSRHVGVVSYWNDHASDEEIRAAFRQAAGTPERQPVEQLELAVAV